MKDMEHADIVMIEDNRHDVEMITDALHEVSIPCKTVLLKDGAEAARYFFDPSGSFAAERNKLPRLILLDLKLPKINGLEVLKMLKAHERTRMIPVVVFTSSNEAKDRLESYQLGVNSYLVKPLDADEFAMHIQLIVRYWMTLNANAD